MKSMTYAVLGAGNGGQSIVAYLTLKGYETTIYDRFEKGIEPLKIKGRDFRDEGRNLEKFSIKGMDKKGLINYVK